VLDTVPARPLTAGAASPTPDELYELRLVAAGQRAADVAIRGGRVVHVHTGEVLPADVLVHGRHLAAIVAPGRLRAEREVDATGQFVAPTFIDAHFHPEYTMLLPGQTARLIVPRGTTLDELRRGSAMLVAARAPIIGVVFDRSRGASWWRRRQSPPARPCSPRGRGSNARGTATGPAGSRARNWSTARRS